MRMPSLFRPFCGLDNKVNYTSNSAGYSLSYSESLPSLYPVLEGMRMFEFFVSLSRIAVPIFVVSTMLNVGLTQKLADIFGCLRRWHFFVRMLIANFILAPLLMFLI